MDLGDAPGDDDRPFSASTAREQLAHAFGVPIEIAARLAAMRGSGKDDGELQLREHLFDALGVSGLRRSAASPCEVGGALPGR